MSAIEELLERVKAATGPDRYADCHLWVLGQGGDARMVVCDSSAQDFVWERGIDGFWIRSVRRFRDTPKYTASADYASALVDALLPGWGIETSKPAGGSGGSCRIYPGTSFEANAKQTSFGRGASVPLAILTALLTAKSAS